MFVESLRKTTKFDENPRKFPKFGKHSQISRKIVKFDRKSTRFDENLKIPDA